MFKSSCCKSFSELYHTLFNVTCFGTDKWLLKMTLREHCSFMQISSFSSSPSLYLVKLMGVGMVCQDQGTLGRRIPGVTDRQNCQKQQ